MDQRHDMTPELLEASPEPVSNASLLKSFVTLTTDSGPGAVEHESDSIRWEAQQSNSRCTSFSPEVVEEFQRSNPGLLVWLKSTPGRLFQVSLICAYVSLETFAALLNSYVLNPEPPPKFKPMPSSMIVMNSGLSIVIGLSITTGISVFSEKASVKRAIPQTCSAVFQCRQILAFSFAGALFSISSVFTMLAYSKIDAGLKKILDQLRLPLTAALSAIVLGRRYSTHEWLTLFIVLLAVCSFYLAHVHHDEVTQLHTKCRYPPQCFETPPYDICALRVDGAQVLGAAIRDEVKLNTTVHNISVFPVKAANMDWRGFVFSFMATFFNCMGSLYSEKVLKSTASTPFPTQKVREETTGFPVAILLSFLVPLLIDSRGGQAVWWTKTQVEGSGEGFFQGYTALTFIAIALDIIAAWMGGIIVKHFSSLVKVMSKCFVLLLTVLSSGTFLKPCQADPLPIAMYSLAFIITSATFFFVTMPKGEVADAPAEDLRTPSLTSPPEFHTSSRPSTAGDIQLQRGGVEVR